MNEMRRLVIRHKDGTASFEIKDDSALSFDEAQEVSSAQKKQARENAGVPCSYGSGVYSVIIQDPKVNAAPGNYSVAEGYGTNAAGKIQHVMGKCNKPDTDSKFVFIIGGGVSAEKLANIHTVDWAGNAYYSGEMTLGDVKVKEELGKKIPGPEKARVGQLLTVEAVDDQGRPTAWKAVTPGWPKTVVFESVGMDGEIYMCPTHTAQELMNQINNGNTVIGVLRDQATGTSKSFFCFTDGNRMVVGDFFQDGGWQHCVGQGSFYDDGDSGNRECCNELWIAY